MFDSIYINIIKDSMHGNDVQETLPPCIDNCQQASSRGKGAIFDISNQTPWG